MHKGKSLYLFALVMAVCLLLCACVDNQLTVVFQDEDGAELCRAAYKDGESEPTFSAPEKDGKTFVEWNKVHDEGNVKVYRATYAETPTPGKYPMPLSNGITVLGGTTGVDGQDCENLFDGDNATCWCVDMNNNARAYAEWSTSEPVEVHGVWVTTAENSSMNPQAWRVSCSTDGQNWEQLYQATSENNIIKEANLWRGIGIFFYVEETGETFTKTAQYFRLEVDQTRGNSLLKLAGFGITTEAPSQDSDTETETPTPDKYPMTLDNGITISAGTTGVDGQDCENLFDGDDNTYWCVNMDENGRASVEWSMPEPVEIYGFDIFTAEDNGMNPQVLKVSGSADGQNWADYWSFTSENNPIPNAQTFYRRFITYHNAADNYNVYVPTAQYFRLEIEATQGNPQLKLRAFGVVTEAPQEEEASE